VATSFAGQPHSPAAVSPHRTGTEPGSRWHGTELRLASLPRSRSYGNREAGGASDRYSSVAEKYSSASRAVSTQSE
jgi:hypothetical protein